MKNNTFIIAQKITGKERKALISTIAEALGVPFTYSGVPTFTYMADGWSIDRKSVLTSPEIEFDDTTKITAVIESLKASGITTEGSLSIIMSGEGQTGISIRNLINVIAGKNTLLQQALKRETTLIPDQLVQYLNEIPIDTVDDFLSVYNSGLEKGRYFDSGGIRFNDLPDRIEFSFYKSTLNIDEILAYVILSQKLIEQAKALKYSSTKEKKSNNFKYSMRIFLLRLGFIGEMYKDARKILLTNVEGNSSYAKPKSNNPA